MIARFFLLWAFHAAGGDTEFSSLGDRDERIGGDVGVAAVGCGAGSHSPTGDEYSVRSSTSACGDVDRGFAAARRGDVRSRVSTLERSDVVLLRRGEVRRGGFGRKTSLMLFFLPNAETDEVELADVFEDIDVNGGRVVNDVTESCSLLTSFRERRVASGRFGEKNVKSSDSTSSDGLRNCGGAGTGAASNKGVVPRCLVGVADARHASKVVCFGTDESRDAPVTAASFNVLVLAFFAGSCKGEGCTGDSAKSRVSIVLKSGGVEGRSKTSLVSAGSVFER